MPIFVRAEDNMKWKTKAEKHNIIELQKERRGGEVKNVIIKVGAAATTTVEMRFMVRGVTKAWNEYRAKVKSAEKVYQKSEHTARVTLLQALRVAAKTKDGAAAVAALEAYFKSDTEADANFDATRIKARGDLVTDIKALFS